MTFVKDSTGEIIEFNGEFAITKQSVSIFNGKIKGDVSISFSLDDNSVNRKILGYYGPQMTNQVAFTKQRFSRMRNGNILDNGYIVIQQDGNALKCFYLSGNSNWVQLLNNLITTLNFDDYFFILNNTLVTSRIGATSGIIFPLVDWCYDLKKENNMYSMSDRLVDSTEDLKKTYFDFYPCLYLHTLLNEICGQNGLKLDGNILDDGLYKSLVITPTNGLMKRDPFKNIYAIGSSQNVNNGVLVKYSSFTEVSEDNELFMNSRYTANSKTGLIFYVTVVSANLSIFNSNVLLSKNGVLISSKIIRFVGEQLQFDLVTTVPGDYFEIYIQNAEGHSISIRLNLKLENPDVIRVNDYFSPKYFLPEIKAIDIFKFLINFFGCSVYYDEYSKTITLNIIEKIIIENSIDWSAYYISHETDYVLDQAENNYINWSTNRLDNDVKNYNSKNNLNFGDGNIITDNSLKEENTLSKLIFSPSSTGISNNGIWQCNVPLINFIDNGDPIPFTSITDAGGGSVIITITDSSIFNINGIFGIEVIRITNSNGVNLGYTKVVLIQSTTTILVHLNYYGDDTGLIYKQKINYEDVGARILTINPSSSIDSVSANNNSIWIDSTPITSFPVGYFTKPAISRDVDKWKNNLAIDNINASGYNDPTIKELYFNKISRMLKNPPIKSKMILPEAVYQSFDFSNFIFLKTEKLTGYFFVESIVNYRDGNTPVEVNLYML